MNTEQERALLPCPFCGGEAFMEEHPPHKHSDWLVKMGMPEYSPGSFTIECFECECGMIHESRDGVVAAWNRRAALQSPEVQALISAAQEFSDLYGWLWDTTEGGGFLSPDGVKRYDAAHHNLKVALCKITGRPLPIDPDEDDE